MVLALPINFPLNNFAQVPTFEDDKVDCGFPNDDPATVQSAFAQDQISSFCTQMQNQPVTTEDALGNDSFISAGMLLNITVSLDSACAGDTSEVLDLNDCQLFLGQTITECDSKSSNKLGGTVYNGCFDYMLHPQDNRGELNCFGSAAGTGVNRDEILADIATFCHAMEGVGVGPGKLISTTYKMAQGDSSATITISYEVTDFCPDIPQASYVLDERSCNRFLGRAVDDCNTNFKPPYGKYGGIVTDNCGVYKLQTNVTEVIGCGTQLANPCGGDPQNNPHNFDLADATKAVADYCSRSLTLSPNPTDPPSGFSQDVPDGWSYDYWYQGLDNWVIKTNATFQEHGDCAPSESFNTGGQECVRKMGNIANQCKFCLKPHSSRAKVSPGQGTYGGYLMDDTPTGCVAWLLFGCDDVPGPS